MSGRFLRSTTVVGITICIVIAAIGGSAAAETAVQRAHTTRQQLLTDTRRLHRELKLIHRRRERMVPLAEILFARTDDRIDEARAGAIRDRSRHVADLTSRRLARRAHDIRHALRRLAERRVALGSWLESVAVFEVCPVPRYSVIHDDFGQMVRLPDVPVHRHMGSDIEAPTWSPIVAPFDGYASTSWSPLGGREVRVRGARGYVYNAHLIALGHLGWVRAGDVIGYVGSTGDSTAPHDHLEWHPFNGTAHDPYPLLAAVCLPV